MTPADRELVIHCENSYPKGYNGSELAKIIRRLDAESRRQRKVIVGFRNRVKALLREWE